MAALTNDQIVEAVCNRLDDKLLDHCEKIGAMVENWTGFEGAPVAVLVGLPMKEGLRLLSAGSKDRKAALDLLERAAVELRKWMAEDQAGES